MTAAAARVRRARHGLKMKALPARQRLYFWLRPRLKNQVHRCHGGLPEPGETALGHDFADAFRPGLSAEGEANFLVERRRHADMGRARVVGPANRVEVVGEAVTRRRLDQQ